MKSTINPNRQAVEWAEFLNLCTSLDLEVSEPDASGRYKFYSNGIEVMHQVRKLKSGQLRGTGWFNQKFGSGSEWKGFPLTSGGKIWIIDTLNPNLPMNIESQKAFLLVLNHVFQNRS